MKCFIALSAVAALIPTIEAHGYVAGIRTGGKYFGGWDPSYQYNPSSAPSVAGWTTTVTDNGFVAPDSYSNPDIICHKGASAGKTFITVAAGDKVDLIWNTWPTSHLGPVVNYLAKCPGDCTHFTTATKTDLNFFKIQQQGLVDGSTNPGKWATSSITQANNYTYTVTIPSNVKAGSYVLRHEIIALHSAGSQGGAQNYPQCINLKVTGSGTAQPAGTPGVKLYTPTGSGIIFNIYTTLTSYPIPGPAMPAAFAKVKRAFFG